MTFHKLLRIVGTPTEGRYIGPFTVALSAAKGLSRWAVRCFAAAQHDNMDTLPSPAGDHEGHPYGSSGLLPLFMA